MYCVEQASMIASMIAASMIAASMIAASIRWYLADEL
jgi:hypothetical protein